MFACFLMLLSFCLKDFSIVHMFCILSKHCKLILKIVDADFTIILLVKFLKFVEKTAPIAVYTSGKGSSAAGLTASVIRDNSSVIS